jgi:cyclopropane fatty-acyl-phospholipid synthase-like methyltransferase
MNNINDSYFDSYYKEIWRTLIPNELTVKEVDFMLSYFNLQPGSKVLDLMCGYGRHAIALAKKGMAVTAVDNLEDYIIEISEIAEKEQLPLKLVKTDILKYKADDDFDLVICMGNSLNFFAAKDTLQLLDHISSHLTKGGHFLINSWSIAEIAIKNFREKSWSIVGEVKFLNDSKYLFHPTRVETESILIMPDGKTEIKTAIDYIFSINEIEDMLNKAGLGLKEIFSIPGRKKFTLGEPRAYILAEKI